MYDRLSSLRVSVGKVGGRLNAFGKCTVVGRLLLEAYDPFSGRPRDVNPLKFWFFGSVLLICHGTGCTHVGMAMCKSRSGIVGTETSVRSLRPQPSAVGTRPPYIRGGQKGKTMAVDLVHAP